MKTQGDREVTTLRLSDLTYEKVIGFYVKNIAIYFAVFAFVWLFWSHLILVDFATIFATPVPLGEALYSVRFILLWPFALAVLSFIIKKSMQALDMKPSNSLEFDGTSGEIFKKGVFISFNAGVFEELTYRWLAFSSAMVTSVFFNWITFGLYKWIMMTILVPIANWATLGYLEPQLLGSEWTIAAAIIVANGDFRSGHNLGLLNKINSWFMGMLFFYMVFHYGIVSAIVTHVLYDCFVFTMVAIGHALRGNSESVS